MKTKPKYSVVTTQTIDSFEIAVMSGGRNAAICYSVSMARKIARALNAMEAKPKAKPFKFDWSGVDPKYKWAALDPDWEWWAYTHKPQVSEDGTCFITQNGGETKVLHKPYPGDWRDSLQKRP